MKQLSGLRMLRILRVARMVRLLKVFRELWLIIKGILDSVRTISWAGVLLVLMWYVFAILFVKVIAAVDIILVPSFLDLASDPVVGPVGSIEVIESRVPVCVAVNVVPDEPCHFTLLNEAISVFVKFVEESLVGLHVWSRFALLSAEVPEEVSGLNLVQSTASIDVVLVPDGDDASDTSVC